IRLARALAFCLLTLGTVATAAAEDFALLVGTSNYKVAGLKGLRFARDDVIEFAETLTRSGYKPRNVILMHDGSTDQRFQPLRANIVRELDLLLERLEEFDTVIVALAGHGVQFQGRKENYYCPIDTDLNREASLIPLSLIYDKLDKCRASHKLLLVD